MEIIMMFYRLNAETRALNPEQDLSKWQDMPVGWFNSEMTDGETFDLIRHYRDDPKWEVVLAPSITLPE